MQTLSTTIPCPKYGPGAETTIFTVCQTGETAAECAARHDGLVAATFARCAESE